MQRDEFDALVARLEAYARDAPGGYRARVVAFALLGYAYLLTVLVALVLAFALLAVLAFSGYGLLIGKLGVGVLALIVLVVRSLRVRFAPPDGTTLHAADAPALFEELEKLRRALGTPRFHEVRINTVFNAAVAEVPRLGVFGWPRHYLMLGLPLLHSVTREQFRAILAHELGHRSSRHGRVGGWVYRLRATWGQLFDRLVAEGRGTWMFKSFFGWYAPRFEAYSFVLARQQEYEADRQAAALTSPEALRDALVAIEVRGRYYEGDLWPAVERRIAREVQPPAGVHAQFAQALVSGPPAVDAARYLAGAIARATDNTDTHPALADRIRALDLPLPAISAVPLPGESAARALLGDLAERLCVGFDASWREAVGPAWRDRHRQMGLARSRHEALAARVAGAGMTGEEQVEHALLTAELDGVETAWPLLEAAATANPDAARLRLVLGRVLLARGSRDGVAHLEAAMALDARLTLAACEMLIGYHDAAGDRERAAALRERAAAEQHLLEQANAERQMVSVGDALLPHGLAAEAVAAVRSQLAAWPDVQRAWLARKAVRWIPEEPYFLLAVQAKLPFYTLDRSAAISRIVKRLASDLVCPGPTYVVVTANRGILAKSAQETSPQALVFEQ